MPVYKKRQRKENDMCSLKKELKAQLRNSCNVLKKHFAVGFHPSRTLRDKVTTNKAFQEENIGAVEKTKKQNPNVKHYEDISAKR